MIRYTFLWGYVVFTIFLSFKDWFKALCMTFILLAVIERPDMPRAIFDISGLNPYNIIYLFILLAWFIQKKKEGLKWNMPQDLNWLFIFYIGLITISFLRMVADLEGFREYPTPSSKTISFVSFFISDYLNSLKYLIPGLLLLYGVNSDKRVKLATWSLLSFGALLSLQVVLRMLPALIGSDDLASRALRVLDRDIGIHRVSIAALTAGFAWAFFAVFVTTKSISEKVLASGGFFLTSLAMALTGGRAGMIAWVGCGFLMGVLRWRILLVIGPVVGLMALAVIPGLESRMEEGISEDSHEQSIRDRGLDVVDSEGRDLYAMSSGRVIAWPLVFERIKKQPFFGYGKRAMIREGITHEVATTIGTRTLAFGHPHNAYLELFLDHGIFGAIPILMFFFLILKKSVHHMRRTKDMYLLLSASVAFSFLITQLLASIGSQSFYPSINSAPLWAVIGLFLASLSYKAKQEVPEEVNEPTRPQRTQYYS